MNLKFNCCKSTTFIYSFLPQQYISTNKRLFSSNFVINDGVNVNNNVINNNNNIKEEITYEVEKNLSDVTDENFRQKIFNNFNELYPLLKLPYKLTHPQYQEKAKQYVKFRLEQYPHRMKPINVEDYKVLYQDLSKHERNKMILEIEEMVNFYNSFLNSVFCPNSISVRGMFFFSLINV